MKMTHLIIGGRYMGKTAYAESIYGPLAPFCDLGRVEIEDMRGARCAVNLHLCVRRLLERGVDALSCLTANIGLFREHVLIGDEIGAGIVPIDPFERSWRDDTGEFYQMLAKEADIVDRVWAGLPIRLKG
jgi:adenosylcobinamide kinase/adenosylcobinamide-phosphate guanylyltransferase